jgi:hypothetical protein
MLKILLDYNKDMNNMTLDYKSINNTLEKFKIQFNNFFDLSYNDKISFDSSDIIHIDKYDYTQFMKRWYYSNNRHNTIEKLEECIQELFTFNKMLKYCKVYGYNVSSFILLNIINDYCNIMRKIKKSLIILQKTYEQDEDIVNRIYIIINNIDSITTCYTL